MKKLFENMLRAQPS